MTANNFALAATIIMLFPMTYFLITTPSFFFFKFDDPVVRWMLRGLFNTYFLAVAACCAIATVAFAVAGRPLVMLAVGLVGALAVTARRWFLQRIDAQIHASGASGTNAALRLRRLHVGGMLYNTVQVAAVILSIPLVFGAVA